jgi:alpha-amylase/alpha-mannosidase (GH57 family)
LFWPYLGDTGKDFRNLSRCSRPKLSHLRVAFFFIQQHVDQNTVPEDRRRTSTAIQHDAMHLLNQRESAELARTVVDIHGSGLTLQQFTAVCWQLFEDISGLEAITANQAKQVINSTWKLYSGKHQRHPGHGSQ